MEGGAKRDEEGKMEGARSESGTARGERKKDVLVLHVGRIVSLFDC